MTNSTWTDVVASFLSVETKQGIVGKVLFSSKQECVVFDNQTRNYFRAVSGSWAKHPLVINQLSAVSAANGAASTCCLDSQKVAWVFGGEIKLSTRKRMSFVASLLPKDDCFLSLKAQTLTDLTFGHILQLFDGQFWQLYHRLKRNEKTFQRCVYRCGRRCSFWVIGTWRQELDFLKCVAGKRLMWIVGDSLCMSTLIVRAENQSLSWFSPRIEASPLSSQLTPPPPPSLSLSPPSSLSLSLSLSCPLSICHWSIEFWKSLVSSFLSSKMCILSSCTSLFIFLLSQFQHTCLFPAISTSLFTALVL